MRECNIATYEYENDNAKTVLECNAEEGEFKLTIYSKDGGLMWDTDIASLYGTMEIEVLQHNLAKLSDIKAGGMFKHDGDYYIKVNNSQAFNIIRNEFNYFADEEVQVKPVKAKLFIEE